jgi:TonB family protein
VFNIKEYYPNGKIKLVGKTSYSYQRVLEKQCLLYYPSGVRKRVATYYRGEPVGTIYDYYPNGKLYQVTENISTQKALNNIDNGRLLVTIMRDSTGKALLNDGTGYYINYEPDFKQICEQGVLKNNLKDSIWKGRTIIDSNIYTFIENYHNGVLLSAQSIDLKGVVHHYNLRYKNPEFPGNNVAFDKYIRENIRYPYLANKTRVQGKVFIQFVVEADGNLSDFNILRDPGSGLADEAIRVLKNSGKWTSGTAYGCCHVRMQVTVPINFSLN